MKRMFLFIAVLACIVLCAAAGYCDNCGLGESGSEQIESGMGQNLESEILGDEAKSESDINQMETSMDTGYRPD